MIKKAQEKECKVGSTQGILRDKEKESSHED